MGNRLSSARCAISAAATLMLLFVACWLGAYFAILPVSHLFIALFTAATPLSVRALATGLCSTLVFGTVTGALFAVIFNATGRWLHR